MYFLEKSVSTRSMNYNQHHYLDPILEKHAGSEQQRIGNDAKPMPSTAENNTPNA